MTKWVFTHELHTETTWGAYVEKAPTSRIVAEYDDESLDEVQDRFREFLRGCGYHVPDDDEEAVYGLLHEAMDLLREVGDKRPGALASDSRYADLCKRYDRMTF
jgi:hypothetical protein